MWSPAIHYWEKKVLPLLPKNAKGLEIGAGNGGLTAYLAQHGCTMLCSDIVPISDETRVFHQKIGLFNLVDYQDFSATAIPHPDNTFDFVVFKSVMGGIGAYGNFGRIQMAISEIHPVLKPGGTLLFAENAHASPLHQFARNKFVRWGKKWHYLTPDEVQSLLRYFTKSEIRTTGFFAAFVPGPAWLKNLTAGLDQLLFFIPKKWRYVVYGYATKKGYPTPFDYFLARLPSFLIH